MPIYEYECKDCGHRFEKLQKMSDSVLKDCPDCQQPELRKLISSVGFQLKGGGWYETDFKSSKKSAEAATNSSNKEPGNKEPGKKESGNKESTDKKAKTDNKSSSTKISQNQKQK